MSIYAKNQEAVFNKLKLSSHINREWVCLTTCSAGPLNELRIEQIFFPDIFKLLQTWFLAFSDFLFRYSGNGLFSQAIAANPQVKRLYASISSSALKKLLCPDKPYRVR
ncbi:MAG: hypothetical protein J7577_20585 [Sphingobacteriaceae bacterium]|nr:hypothetical protein [Sphingobacteriaceae bacterium]